MNESRWLFSLGTSERPKSCGSSAKSSSPIRSAMTWTSHALGRSKCRDDAFLHLQATSADFLRPRSPSHSRVMGGSGTLPQTGLHLHERQQLLAERADHIEAHHAKPDGLVVIEHSTSHDMPVLHARSMNVTLHAALATSGWLLTSPEGSRLDITQLDGRFDDHWTDRLQSAEKQRVDALEATQAISRCCSPRSNVFN